MLKRKAVGFISVFLFFIVFGLAWNVYAAGKFGYVDLSAAFDKYEKTKVYDESLSTVQQTKEKELEQMASEIKAIEDKMSLLSEKEKTSKQQEVEEKKKKLTQTSQQIALDLRKERDEKLKDILQDIEKVIQGYAQKNGYDFILNDRVLLYGAASADVTQEIVDLLNAEYKQPGKSQASSAKSQSPKK
jgi:outer membrane protein